LSHSLTKDLTLNHLLDFLAGCLALFFCKNQVQQLAGAQQAEDGQRAWLGGFIGQDGAAQLLFDQYLAETPGKIVREDNQRKRLSSF
jgi:hypothetical protein